MLKAAVETLSFTDMMTCVTDSSNCGVIRERLVWFTSTKHNQCSHLVCLGCVHTNQVYRAIDCDIHCLQRTPSQNKLFFSVAMLKC